jgi:hypothetical protein
LNETSVQRLTIPLSHLHTLFFFLFHSYVCVPIEVYFLKRTRTTLMKCLVYIIGVDVNPKKIRDHCARCTAYKGVHGLTLYIYIICTSIYKSIGKNDGICLACLSRFNAEIHKSHQFTRVMSSGV